jgi:hypothetical protein
MSFRSTAKAKAFSHAFLSFFRGEFLYGGGCIEFHGHWAGAKCVRSRSAGVETGTLC